MPKRPILVVAFHGLLLKGGMNSFVLEAIRRVPGVVVEPLASWTDWREKLAIIRKLSESYAGVAAIGHSMGAGAASYLTDYTYIDRVYMLDAAGQRPSEFGNNTGAVFDFHDVAFSLVPKYRAQLVKGQPASKLLYYKTFAGHMGITYDQSVVDTIAFDLKWLAKQKGAV